jgi:hypothetical protein
LRSGIFELEGSRRCFLGVPLRVARERLDCKRPSVAARQEASHARDGCCIAAQHVERGRSGDNPNLAGVELREGSERRARIGLDPFVKPEAECLSSDVVDLGQRSRPIAGLGIVTVSREQIGISDNGALATGRQHRERYHPTERSTDDRKQQETQHELKLL